MRKRPPTPGHGLARRLGRSTGSASSAFSSAFARMTFLAPPKFASMGRREAERQLHRLLASRLLQQYADFNLLQAEMTVKADPF